MNATSTFCFSTTPIKKWSEFSDRQACCLCIVSGFTIKFGKSKPQTTNLSRCFGTVVPAFLHHCTLRYVNVMTGCHSHLVMRGGLGKSSYCFHWCSVWLHCWVRFKISLTAIILFIINSFFQWILSAYMIERLPRPQAAAAAIRAILAWVSSLTSVHSSQHCWCNWPLEKH